MIVKNHSSFLRGLFFLSKQGHHKVKVNDRSLFQQDLESLSSRQITQKVKNNFLQTQLEFVNSSPIIQEFDIETERKSNSISICIIFDIKALFENLINKHIKLQPALNGTNDIFFPQTYNFLYPYITITVQLFKVVKKNTFVNIPKYIQHLCSI